MLSVTKAQMEAYVRRSLDEMGVDASMELSGQDDTALGEIVSGCAPEAIRTVHLQAPAGLVEGNAVTPTVTLDETVARLSFGTKRLLRIVRCKSADSAYTVDGVTLERSVLGRMQLDKYTRGTYDKPVLVLLSESVDFKPVLRYYSLRADTVTPAFIVSAVPYPEDTAASWEISPPLKDAVFNYVTALTLLSLDRRDRAEELFKRAASLSGATRPDDGGQK